MKAPQTFDFNINISLSHCSVLVIERKTKQSATTAFLVAPNYQKYFIWWFANYEFWRKVPIGLWWCISVRHLHHYQRYFKNEHVFYLAELAKSCDEQKHWRLTPLKCLVYLKFCNFAGTGILSWDPKENPYYFNANIV